jgi:hypothetical protein
MMSEPTTSPVADFERSCGLHCGIGRTEQLRAVLMLWRADEIPAWVLGEPRAEDDALTSFADLAECWKKDSDKLRSEIRSNSVGDLDRGLQADVLSECAAAVFSLVASARLDGAE